MFKLPRHRPKASSGIALLTETDHDIPQSSSVNDPAGQAPVHHQRHAVRTDLPRRLNIGCGYDKRPGYLNIDMDPACEPDLLVSPDDDSMIPRGYFQKIVAKDVLEHIPRANTLSALLSWAEYLQVGGQLEVQTSSIYGVVDMMRDKPTFAHHYGMTICLFGNQAHPGDFHYTGFTEETLRVFLLSAGFMPISFEIVDQWLFKVCAFKFFDWTVSPQTDDPIRAIFQAALGRDPDDWHHSHWANKPLIEVARAIYGSEERLHRCAQLYGL